jgi:hypothetical protein
VAVAAPQVVSVRSNVVVRLAPSGPMARVGGLTAEVRDVRAHFAREVALCRHLAARGAPAARPYEPAGPHERDGHVVTLWEAAPEGPPPPADEAGPALRACHEALRTLPSQHAPPPLADLLGEALGLAGMCGLQRGERLLLRGHLLRASAEVLASGLPAQALHGDAGPGNVLPGPLWNDWEDCCTGPVVWDLASLVASPRVHGEGLEHAEATLAAYGPFEGDLDTFVHARAAQVAAWAALAVSRGSSMPARLQARLDWLRER